MDKDEELYNLRLNISTEAKRIQVLLEHLMYKSDNTLEISVLAGMAYDNACRISEMSENIGKILEH